MLALFIAGCDGGVDTLDMDVDGAFDLDDGGVEVLLPEGDLTTVPGPGYTAPGSVRMRVVDGATGAPVDDFAFWQRLTAARLVCAGEIHDDFFHHSVQYLIAHTLGQTAPERMGMGFEPFERDFQPVLDEFGAGVITEAQLLERTQYQTRWGYDWLFYRPLVRLALHRQHPLIGLNPAQEITRKVAQTGLDSLTAEERARVPELDLDGEASEAHREWFRQQISPAHGTLPPDRFENFYTAQVIRDETMAAAIAQRLAQPQQLQIDRVVGIMGWGHCVSFAVPMRVRRRGVNAVVSLRVVEDLPEVIGDAVAEGLFDLLVVRQ